MDEKPAAIENRPRFDSVVSHGGDAVAAAARPRFDSIPISPLDHVAAGDNDSEFGAGEFAYSGFVYADGQAALRKQPHSSNDHDVTDRAHSAAAAAASMKMTPPQEFQFMPAAALQSHQPQHQNNNFWTCDDSMMAATKKQAPTTSSSSPSSMVCKIPHRENAFSAASWWLVDREHEPPILQGATALAERCLTLFPRWDEPFVRRVLKAYRQYLAMVVSTNDWRGNKLFPPPLVRQVWELHRKGIVAYCHDCMILFGQLVGNNLQDDDTDTSSITPQQAQRRDVTLQALQSQFGSQYDEEIWTYHDVQKNAVAGRTNDGSTNVGMNRNAAGRRSTNDDSATGSSSSSTSSSSSSTSSSSSCNGKMARTSHDDTRHQGQRNPAQQSDRATTTGAGARGDPDEDILMEEGHVMGDEDEKKNDDEDYTLFPELAEQAKDETHSLLSNGCRDENNDQDDSPHSGSYVKNLQDQQQRQREAEDEDEIEDRMIENNSGNEAHGRSVSDGCAIISICVRTEDDKGSKTWFRVRPDTRMGKVFENLPYIKFGVTTPSKTKFYVQGEEDRPIRPADTVQKLALWDKDVIILKTSAETVDDESEEEEESEDERREEESVGEGEELEGGVHDGEKEGERTNGSGGLKAQAALTDQAGPSQPKDDDDDAVDRAIPTDAVNNNNENGAASSEIQDDQSTPEAGRSSKRGPEEMTSPTASEDDIKAIEASGKVAEGEDNGQEGAGEESKSNLPPPSRVDLILKRMGRSKGSVVEFIEYAADENMAKNGLLLESKPRLPAPPARVDRKLVSKRKGRSKETVVESVEYANEDMGKVLNLGSEDEPEPEPAPKRRKKSPKRAPESTTLNRTSRKKVRPAYYGREAY